MLRRSFPIILLLCLGLLLLMVLPFGSTHVSAQDVTPEVTVEQTPVVIVTPAPAPAPILTPDNAISVSTILYGVIIALLGGGTVGLVINRFGSNKQNLDAAEKLYQSLSPESQTHLRQMFESLRDVTVRALDIVDKVTDGQPNADEPTAMQMLLKNPYLTPEMVAKIQFGTEPSTAPTNVGPGENPVG